MGLMAQWPTPDKPHLTNKLREKETNEQMHGRNTESWPDSVTTVPKRILSNADLDAAMHKGGVSRNISNIKISDWSKLETVADIN